METTCGSLLHELQIIWNEVGESDSDRDRKLFKLEQECLEVYRRTVDQENRSRAQLHQEIADHETELAVISSAMCEQPVHIRQSDHATRSLKEELNAIIPQLEEMRRMKNERLGQFLEVLEQMQKLSMEVLEPSEYHMTKFDVDETDLSIKRLDELRKKLQFFQEEKSGRLRRVLSHLNTVNCLCAVLGMNFLDVVSEVHPSLNDPDVSKSISTGTMEKLEIAVEKLREIKIQRMQKLQDLATSMLELWNLMDIPVDEQQSFRNVTCKIAAAEHEIIEQDILSPEFLSYVEDEVARLEKLKSSKMKELVLKKRSELEEMCRRTCMVEDADVSTDHVEDAINSDPATVLEQIELEIARVKEEAFSRKEIIDKVDKWFLALEEEAWLEEYNKDDNRYNAGRGSHLALKRAEKARATVAKLPAMVEALISKTLAWERERGIEFTFDGVRLLTMLEEYTILRQEKEEERLRKREEKKLQGQLTAEQEARFGSKPSPLKTPNVKRPSRQLTGNVNKRLSLGVTPQTKTDISSVKFGAGARTARKSDFYQEDGFLVSTAGRKGLDNCNVSMPMPSNELATARKPFSPVPCISSKANIPDPCDASLTTPTKLTLVADEENKTPVGPTIPAPKTPSMSMSAQMGTSAASKTPSMSVSMQTTISPAPIQFGGSAEDDSEDVEYSFEEKRLAFVLSSMNVQL